MNLFQRRALEKTATNEAVTRSDENAMTALAILEFERIANALDRLVELVEDGFEEPKEVDLGHPYEYRTRCEVYGCDMWAQKDRPFCELHAVGKVDKGEPQ